MKRSIKTVADALDLPPSTIERWIRQGRIPVQRHGDRVAFSAPALQKWAQAHQLPFSLRPETADPPTRPPAQTLVAAMQNGTICTGIEGQDPASTLQSIVDRMDFLDPAMRQELLTNLIQREQLASTGIGNGIALPHPREPLSQPPVDAVIATCFSKQPIPFGAIDDQPVSVFFVLISPTVKDHLHLLSRLSFCIRDTGFVTFLQSRPNAQALHARIAQFEKQLDDL